eukprot:989049-Prorocentrum_lima.AAC.1
MLEPRTVLTVVEDTMETGAYNDDLQTKVMMEELSAPALRNPQHMEDVASFVRGMLGEVWLRTEEEKSTRASRDVSA